MNNANVKNAKTFLTIYYYLLIQLISISQLLFYSLKYR